MKENHPSAQQLVAPPNLIEVDCASITPEMLTLVELDQQQIDSIVQTVPDGAKNVQDIYPLTPLQEGMLFQHLLNMQSDTYVVSTLLELQSRDQLQALINALQRVIDRHDVLRTAVLWEQLPRPVQVVYRQAQLSVEQLVLEPDRDAIEQLKGQMTPERQKWNLRQAPLMRLKVAADAAGTHWYVLLEVHHLVCDYGSFKTVVAETMAYLEGRSRNLPEPVAYRTHVAQALTNARAHEAEAYFKNRLSTVDAPTAPFGLLDVHGDGTRIEETHRLLDPTLAQRARAQARHLGVSAARLFFAAWALVVSRASERDDVVFGTALLASPKRGGPAQPMVGMFVNTLPLRLQLHGVTARELIEQTQRELGELLNYVDTPLVTAQRCSGIVGSAPLFTSLLTYRHSIPTPEADWSCAAGIRVLTAYQFRTSYPVTLTVDNLGEGFALTAQTDRRIDPRRITDYLETALQSLVEALEREPQTPALTLSILPNIERHEIIDLFNATQTPYPQDRLIHELFQEQVRRTPNATAVVYEEKRLTYAQLNEQSNQFAHYLSEQGVQIGEYIPIIMPRCLHMLIAQLAVLKSGGVYVPVDPTYPIERHAFIIRDCSARRVISEQSACAALEIDSIQRIDCTKVVGAIADFPKDNLRLQLDRSPPAYVMYTSGSTGLPKGVVVPHPAVNRLVINNGYALIESTDCIAHCSNPAFDASTFEIWAALLNGAGVLIVPQSTVLDGRQLSELLKKERVTVLWLTVGLFMQYKEVLSDAFAQLRYLLVGGDVVEPSAVRWVLRNCPPRHLINGYGPTECTTFSATYLIESVDDDAATIPIGRPISNTQMYVLDSRLQPVPIGAAGEIYIGGAGVALGYLNRPELSAERFIANPFSTDPEARLYKSGDRGRWRADGILEFLGRVDEQVKIRGYRIEPGEIVAHLLKHSHVKEAAVLAREDTPGERQLVCYVVGERSAVVDGASDEVPEQLRNAIVGEWETLYEDTYGAPNPTIGPSFVGWNSSYTGEPIPKAQMQEWLASTVERIKALRPNRVLEIGCGVGLLLHHLAPQCLVYIGTDFSASALGQLRQWIGQQEDLKHVELLHRSATEFQGLEAGSFDTVVLNSVVQYFPDIDYLMTVLQGAVRLLRPGGKIFIGDVRHLGTLPMFHSAVQLSKSPATVSVGQLRKRIARAVAQDKELAIDPQFFRVLPGHLPGIGAAEVHLKRGHSANELTRYRYDVTLQVGEQVGACTVCEPLEWKAAVGSIAEFEAALSERRWSAVSFHGIANQRLAREKSAQKLIDTSDERLEARTLRTQLNELRFEDIDPESIWAVAHAHGYDVTVRPAEQGCFEVRLLDRARRDEVPRAVPRPDVAKAWSAYANDPLENVFRQQLIPRLREYLKGRVPEYMVPSTWMVLKQLPLTPNGKLDRRALPAPLGRAEDMGEYIAPRTEMERTLADIWVQLLPVDQVGVHDNFFELGGHSLLATRVLSQIRERLELELSVRALFDAPTIEQLGAYIEGIRREEHQLPPLVRQVRERTIPASYAQERLWFLDHLGLVGSAYNMPFVLRLSGELNEEALELSFTELMRRHEVLRTRFEVQDGLPHQVIDPPGPFKLHRVVLSRVTDRQDREQQLQELMKREQLHRFNLSEGPLVRLVLVRLEIREHILLLTMHHIVSDGWSMGVLNRELGALYGAYSQGQPSPLAELPVQYADYAIWQRQWLQGKVLQEQLQYWKKRLLGAPPQLDLPTDRPRPAVESFKGATLSFELPATLSGALKEFARREGATLFMVSLAAYQLLLSRWSGQQDIVVGSPIAGRRNRELEGLIGFFVNTLALRTDVSGNLTFRQLLERVKEVTLGAYAHQDLPFETLVKELRPERNLTRQPIFQVWLALHNFPEERRGLAGLTWTWTAAEWVSTHFDLVLYLHETAAGLSGIFEYATDLFDEVTIERMAGTFRTLLEGIVANPDCPIALLPLLSDTERRQLLVEWNGAVPTDVDERCVHDLFAEQVERTPDAIAVVCEGQSLTYAELNGKANQLARYLKKQGVGPDKLVGLCVERGLEMVVGLLGVLKAGGAYVPLDPNYPVERLAYMLKDSAPKVLLIHEHLRERIPNTAAKVIALDNDWDEIAKNATRNVPLRALGLSFHHLAYVIYTSGSTGEPKGVMVEHRNVTRLFAATEKWFGFNEQDVWTLFHSFAFDFSVWELWGALLNGGRVVVVPYLTARFPQEFYRQLCAEGVTVLNQTPSAFAQLIDAQAQSAEKHSLRVVIFGGEALDLRTLQPWVARNGAGKPQLVNMYGITETTVHVTYRPLTEEDIKSERGSLIGKPIPDLRTYLLDQHRQPVPIGVSGEIYVGGAGVARGYLNRPELTSERFVTDPFSADPQARLYKTGDLARWRADGTIDYLGRNDDQVKIRGYRIELGEIEAQLLRHTHVKQALVIAREDVPGEKRLVAYVVGIQNVPLKEASDRNTDKVRKVIVGEWETLYDETYGTQNQTAGPSFVGWNSSYTGEPIPEAQMQEWLAGTVTRIRELQPNRVLEIGCGVGLLLQHLAPQCQAYVGADFSAAALKQLRQWMNWRKDLKHVELLQRSAAELQDLQAESFDTVVLNSVVQYFPDIEYLVAVLQEAVRLLGPGGKIFIGDVRHLGLLLTFHSAVQLSKAAASVNIGQLRKRIARAAAQDKELVIDPQFFQVLPGRLPGIRAVEVQLKRGRAPNELTRYRYDVVLHTAEQTGTSSVCAPFEWRTTGLSPAELETALRERRWSARRLHAIPNSRLAREAAGQRLIETSDENLDAGVLRRQLNEMQFDESVDPEKLWEIGEAHGYDVQVRWDPHDSPECFQVQLVDRARSDEVSRAVFSSPQEAKPWSAYANDPLKNGFRQQLVPQLREYLKARLPEYMVPSTFVMLESFPLNPNGKVDRPALPAPDLGAYVSGDYEAPQGTIEEVLAEIWQELMRVERVGRHDNFFELGGHSLLAVKMLFTINQYFRSDLRAIDVYQSPTIRDLAVRVSGAATVDEFVQLREEAALDEKIVAISGPRRIPAEAVLLTGCTGFVGRFLLPQLLEDSDATLYCLIRARSAQQALSRLKVTLLKWDLWRDEFERRIVPVPGDLSLPHLGVDASTYGSLCQNIDSIYHCGASMNHLETYSMAKGANVDGVRELLKVATRHKPKLVNYISTLGIFSSSGTGTSRIVNEETPIDYEKHRGSGGYTASKWVGEKLFMTAAERGIHCNIFRLGLVWADTQQGRYDQLQRGHRIIKSCLLSGLGIKNYRHDLPPTPVDYVARAVVFLGNRHSEGLRIFHISSSSQPVEGLFERCNEVADTSLKLLSFYEWIQDLKRLHYEGRSLPAVPLLEFAFSMDEASLEEHQRSSNFANIRFDCTRTYRELERAGIVAPELDDDLIRVCIDSMLSRDEELRGLRAREEDQGISDRERDLIATLAERPSLF